MWHAHSNLWIGEEWLLSKRPMPADAALAVGARPDPDQNIGREHAGGG